MNDSIPSTIESGSILLGKDGGGAPDAERRAGSVKGGSVKARSVKAGARKVVLLAVVVAAAVFGGKAAYESRIYEETDDAQIDGEIASVGPRIAGTVLRVLVKENQIVEEGQVIAELDTAELAVSLAQAKAYVAQAEAMLHAETPNVAIAETSSGATIATTSSEVAGASAELAAVEALRQRRLAQLTEADVARRSAAIELERAQQLARSGASSAAEIDARKASLDSARAAYDAATHDVKGANESLRQMRSRIAAAHTRQAEAKENAPRQLDVKKALLDVRRAAVEVAKAQLAQAELNMQFATVRSPVRGIVGRKSVSVGDRVQPGQPLLVVTPIDDVWVTANFRETQLRAMHPDQRVTVHVDAIDRDFVGVVESLPGATGARFSLLPPENATGNYVKVVQRMPVRIRLEPGQPEANRLRAGMSVEPKVRVR
jgi:membrane fusion protein (multidrug efflux system)